MNELKENAENLDIRWIGFDSGEIYPLAYGVRKPSEQMLAFGKFDRDSYYHSCVDPVTSFINSHKPTELSDLENELSSNPDDQELKIQCFEQGRLYYNSDEVKSFKALYVKKKVAYFDLFFDQFMRASGFNFHTKAEDFESDENMVLVVVFEVGSKFGSVGRKGSRSPMHVEVQNYMIRKVCIYIDVVAWVGSFSCWF